MRSNKGFTLIELLAVIVIISIIAIIAVPIITGIIDSARKSAYRESLRNIFPVMEIYIATNNFMDFPEEGVNITNPNIQMKNKSFTSGKVIKNEDGNLELESVSNGNYCGYGTLDKLVVIEGSCDSLDTTPPTIIISSSQVTSNSITIVSDAEDLESGINGYQFSIDNGVSWTSKQISNVYTFTGLAKNTSYTIKGRVYNNNQLITESEEMVVTTTDISAPTYSVDITGWSQNKVVTINYPQREAGYVYEYSLDEGLTWEEVVSPNMTKDITFNSNGSVIARISDGINTINGASYQITNIDTTPPIITLLGDDPISVAVGSVYNDPGATAIDSEMGDISGDIQISNNVDVNNEGSYTVTYNVSDAAGNSAIEVTRTVNVVVSRTVLAGSYEFSTSVSANVSRIWNLRNDGTIQMYQNSWNYPSSVDGYKNVSLTGIKAIGAETSNLYAVNDNGQVIRYGCSYSATSCTGSGSVMSGFQDVVAVAGTYEASGPSNSSRVWALKSDGTVRMYQDSWDYPSAVDGYKDTELTGIKAIGSTKGKLYAVNEAGNVISLTCSYSASTCTGSGSVMSGFQDVVAVAGTYEASGSSYSSRVWALKSDGTVKMYQNSWDYPSAVDGYKNTELTGIKAIGASKGNLYAVNADGNVISLSCSYSASTCTGSGSIMTGFTD